MVSPASTDNMLHTLDVPSSRDPNLPVFELLQSHPLVTCKGRLLLYRQDPRKEEMVRLQKINKARKVPLGTEEDVDNSGASF